MDGIVIIAVVAYLIVGFAVPAVITHEARRDPVTAAEWELVRWRYWQMVILWPVIYGAVVEFAIRQYRKRHNH
jgi:hypothetical protein